MIFATVGTQLPFPRLIAALNTLSFDEEVVAQTGQNDIPAANITAFESLSPKDFEHYFTSARVVIAHAGIGTILSAKRYQKPLILFPRRFEFAEHRNDHQLATARQVEAVRGVYVAWTVADIAPLLARTDLVAADENASPARERLITRVSNFIAG